MSLVASGNASLFAYVVARALRTSQQCKMSYDAEWMQVPHGHCPNLVPIPADWDTPLRRKPLNEAPLDTYQVTVRQNSPRDPGQEIVDTYDSLADMWTEFHKEYDNADFPRLMVRFEDLLFHRETVLSQIAQCIAPPSSSLSRNHQHHPNTVWKYRLHSVKEHGPLSKFDLVSGVIQYGTSRGRYAGMADEDVRYAARALDRKLLQKFHYHPGPSI
jgi:hypothetical protein